MVFYYNPEFKSNFKIQFPGLDRITSNYSNMSQDMFAIAMMNGKTNGTYLEIGAHKPKEVSNTYILESVFGWRGASVEIDPQLVDQFRSERANPILCHDALTVDYIQLLQDNGIDLSVDYLSCDVEPPENTFSALKKIDHNRIRFKVITFEHDAYNENENGPKVREESRVFLTELGYELVLGNIGLDGFCVEDWYVDPLQIDRTIVDSVKNLRDGYKFHKDMLYSF
jgi:hypothetical protein